MTHTQAAGGFLIRGITATVALMSLVLLTGRAPAQDLILNGNITNNGAINVNRNVINNTAGAVAVSGTGLVRLQGTGVVVTHSIQGGTGISFTNLNMRGTRPTTLNVATTVLDQLRVGDATAYTAAGVGFSVGTTTLTLGGASNNGASTYGAGSTAALTFSGGTVAFASGSAQSILNNAGGVTYGTLALSNAGAKNLTTGGTVAAATFTQAGGTVSVNENVDVTGSATLADVGSISAAKNLRLTAAATGGTITAMNNASTGTLENAGTGTLTVTTLSGNAGTINQSGGSTGKVAFTNNVSNGGTIQTATGTLDFQGTGAQTNTGGTVTVTGAGFAEVAGDIATSPGTLTFNSGSTVTYDGAAQTLAPVTYGTLVAGGSAAKTASSSFTVASNLTLNQNITMSSGTLSMTSTTAANVTGTAEVLGAVRRNHNFATGQNYLFNRADVYLGTATTAGTDITLNMSLATPSGTLPSTKYIQRNYAITPTTAGNLETAQLHYEVGEVQGGATQAKLGARSYNGSTWAKLNNTGYTRTSGSNVMTLSGLNNSLAGLTELAMFQINFITSGDGANLSLAAGWDENAIPDNTDDIIIRNTGILVGASNLSVAVFSVEAGKDVTTNAAGTITAATSSDIAGTLTLTSANANLAAISTSGSGNIQVATGRTLTGTSFTNNSSTASTFTGDVSLSSLTNTSGTLNFNGGASTITGAFSNSGTANVGGTLDMATSSALTVTSSGTFDLTSVSSILNVGAIGIASNLQITGAGTLAVTNAAGALNVFGNLDLASGVTLTNNGTITVGE